MLDPINALTLTRTTDRLIDGLRWLLLVLLTLLIVVTLGIAIWRMMQLSEFGGDEGLFAEMARLIVREDGMIYRDMWDIKPPGLFVILAPFVALLGNTIIAIRIGNLVITLVFIAVMTLLAYQLTRSRPAAFVALLLALLYGAYNDKPETVFTMTTLGAAAASLVIAGRGRWVWLLAAGLIFAWGVWTKQPLITDLPALLLLAALFAGGKWLRAGAAVLAGAALGCGVLVAWLLSHDLLEQFWFYTFSINQRYVLSSSGRWHFDEGALDLFERYFVGGALPFLLPVLLLALIAVVVLLRQRSQRRLTFILLLWLATAFVGAALGRGWRADYFQQMLPPFILLIALAVPFITSRVAQVGLLALALVLAFRFSDGTLESFDPFAPDTYANRNEVLTYIAAHSEPGDCLWTWGFLAHVNYLSDRKSCNSAAQEGYMMDSTAFPIERNRLENMDDLLAASPEILVITSPWGFYDELQKYADRYITGQVIDNGRFQVYAVDRSKWQPMHADFAGEIALIGYDLMPRESFCPGDTLTMTLTWRQLSVPTHQYQVFVQVLTPDETANLASWDGQPADHPTNEWVTTGEAVLGDTFALTLPDSTSPGVYPLVAGLYDVETLERAPLLDDNGMTVGTYALLREINIEACG
jgi:4-amino-4-deoxy-L-arabinose transferase-like glycosyltransferase